MRKNICDYLNFTNNKIYFNSILILHFLKSVFDKLNGKIFGKKDMTILLSELYLEKDKSLKSFLAKNNYYSITTDGWSSKKKKKAFISLTIHYLDVKFKLENISLGIISADYEHNAENLSGHLKELLEKYEIFDKVSIIVVDHASVMGKTCELMRRDFYGCFAHFLNLVCRLFFDSLKKYKFDIVSSPDPESREEDEITDRLNEVSNILRNEVESEKDAIFLQDIEEETEEELAQEAVNLQSEYYEALAMKINNVITKVKNTVTTFNSSNNLSRELLKSQRENGLNLLSDFSYKRDNKNFNCVLQLIQDIITRLF